MPEQDQKMRFTKAELSLMRNTFNGNDALLYALRKHMLGFTLEELESSVLKKINGDTLKLVEKVFYPQIDANSPLFQIVDMVTALNVDMKGQSEDYSKPFIKAKKIEMDYIKGKLAELSGGKAEYKTLQELADLDSEDAYTNIIARNYLLSYIDSFINEVKFLSFKREDETTEEALERMKKDSTK